MENSEKQRKIYEKTIRKNWEEKVTQANKEKLFNT